MLHVSTLGFVRAVTVALAVTAPPSADRVCRPVQGRRMAVLRCRGSLSMGAQGTPLTADADLTLFFRGTSGATGRNGALLEPGSCAWADGPVRSDEPRVLVLPMNGPMAADPYPIGHVARACAADNGCVMEFCAYTAGRELHAVDGFIRLIFGGSD